MALTPITRDLKNLSVFYTLPAPLFTMDCVAELEDSECVFMIRKKTWAESLDLVLQDFLKASGLQSNHRLF